MWPLCLKFNVAAITYGPISHLNLSKYTVDEPKKGWRELKPAQKASLRRVAYEMKKGDTIYAKGGRFIVGKGTVLGRYRYDKQNRIRDPNGHPWNHQVPVKWQLDFPKILILLGTEQYTVLPLTTAHVKTIEGLASRARKKRHKLEVIEGQRLKAERTFLKRNRGLIEAKKALSDGRCEACGMNFKDSYRIEKLCLVAHHKKPLGSRMRASKTTIDDIDLICPNCHAVVHSANPALSITAIRKRPHSKGAQGT